MHIASMIQLPTVVSVPSMRTLERSSASYWGKRFTVLILVTWGIGLVGGFELSLQVLIATGLIGSIFGLRWPAIGLLGMSTLCTLDTVSRSLVFGRSAVWHYNTYNYWLLIVILFSVPLLLKFKDVQTRILQAFLLLLAIEVGFSAAWENGFQHLVNIVTIFGLLVYFVRAPRDKDTWYWLGVVNGTLGAAGALVFYAQESHLPQVNHNALAYFPLTAMLAICLSVPFVAGKLRRQMTLGALAIVNYFWVFLSGSRGGLVVATVCLVFLFIKATARSTRVVYVGLVMATGLLLFAAFTDLQEKAVSRVEKLLDVNRSHVSRTSGRSDLALAAWYMFLDHPFGVGTGGFASTRLSDGYAEKVSGWEADTAMEAHAGWMKTLAENGVPGMLLQIAFVLSFAMVGWRRRRNGLFSLGLLVTVILSTAFVTTEVQSKGLWFLAAGSFTLLRRTRYNSASKSKQQVRSMSQRLRKSIPRRARLYVGRA